MPRGFFLESGEDGELWVLPASGERGEELARSKASADPFSESAVRFYQYNTLTCDPEFHT